MEPTDLTLICGIAFLIVFLILAFLAFIMRIIMLVFPEKAAEIDPAIVAAVAATVQTVFPGTKITKLEEKK
ncbi:MAG: hypothetical protein PVI66_02965 [Candidatus Aminicenantes bacterium]|jgi:hypothetical protein